MKPLTLSDLPNVWQGGVNQWECDQMGHMNTQFYFHRLAEGLAFFAGLIGLPDAFSSNAEITLTCHRQNVRFIREARIPASLKMKMGVVSINQNELEIFAVILSGETNEVTASFLCRVTPVSPSTNIALEFPKMVLDLAATYQFSPPENLLPRTFDTGNPNNTNLPDFASNGFRCIASGAFLASTCDMFGKMRIDQPAARLSDGMTLLMENTRRIVIKHASTHVARVGGAMLEGKFDILDWARTGQAFELWSKVAHAGPKLTRIESWLINPYSKVPLAILETVSAVFDLDAREIVPVTKAAAQELEQHGIPSSF